MNKLISLSVAVLFLFAFSVPQSFGFFLSKHKKVEAEDGVVRLAIDKIGDGSAHYFVYNDNGQDVKFFVVRSQDGVIRAAFDACDVCFHSKKGYSQEGDFMVCNNCGRKFHSSRINIVKGGCNPAPLHRVEQGKHLVLKVSDIVTGARYF